MITPKALEDINRWNAVLAQLANIREAIRVETPRSNNIRDLVVATERMVIDEIDSVRRTLIPADALISREQLRQLEWASSRCPEYAQCQICNVEKLSDEPTTHKADCWLGKMLKEKSA